MMMECMCAVGPPASYFQVIIAPESYLEWLLTRLIIQMEVTSDHDTAAIADCRWAIVATGGIARSLNIYDR